MITKLEHEFACRWRLILDTIKETEDRIQDIKKDEDDKKARADPEEE